MDKYKIIRPGSSEMEMEDPLSTLSGGSSCSSWGSDCSLPSFDMHDRVVSIATSSNESANWQLRYQELQMEMAKYISQAARNRQLLHDKLSELENRVIEAECRADDAEDKVRQMEDRLEQVSSEWSTSGTTSGVSVASSTSDADTSTSINKLASEVEEQRQLRLQDAKLVELKAAKIKEWVTNKLKDLEAQNQHLREQNHKCNEQLELLRRHMAQLSVGRMADSLGPPSRPNSLYRANSTGSSHRLSIGADGDPIYAQIDRENKIRQLIAKRSVGETLSHRRHHSECSPPPPHTSMILDDSADNACDELTNDLNAAIQSISLYPLHLTRKSNCSESELTHDYAEIYTPSVEQVSTWNEESRPPTPPLHRCPSWESRIYQVANKGLSSVASLTHSSHVDNSAATSAAMTNNVKTQTQPSSISQYLSNGFTDLSCPVYATVQGRASQIRSSPFSGDSSDDSSDGEGGGDHSHSHQLVSSPRTTNSSSTDNTDTSIVSSSPSKSQKTSSSLSSPLKRSSCDTSTKNTSLESGISDDYAIPPDATSCGGDSINWPPPQPQLMKANSMCHSPVHYAKENMVLEKCGYLTKLGGKLKTWRRRWFHLSPNGKLRYWKTQGDLNKKARGEIIIDDACKITKGKGGATFQISTNQRNFYLTADSVLAMEDWIKVLSNVQKRNVTKATLMKENVKPTLQGWLTKVRNGHSKKCWCTLVGKTFLYFKSSSDNTPLGQIYMKEARVEEVEHVSDSDSDEREAPSAEDGQLTIGIFPASQPPTYLLMPSKQEKDSWLYHLTVVSGGNEREGTQFEQIIQKLLELDGDANCVLWRHPTLVHSKEPITQPLTSLPSETMQAEALKLFKSCQLFMSVAVESAGIDYHVVLAQNALQLCLDVWQLQAELMCILIKQTTRLSSHKTAVQVLSKLRNRQLLSCASQSLFTCDSGQTSSIATSPSSNGSLSQQDDEKDDKANPAKFVFLQGWQLLALAVSLFTPKDNKVLWFLKSHLRRNSNTKSEFGKYASYCQRALERTLKNGGRDVKPSRMEVLSILLKNPYHHSLPHSMPVHLLNGAYHVVGFDGSTTVEEFLITLNHEIGCRDSAISGFTLFSDDPIQKDLEHYIDPRLKLCDVISKWETGLREKGSGKFENTKVIRLVYKNRLYFRHRVKKETDRERILLCYQMNEQIVAGKFPITQDLALELAALMSQIDFGEFGSDKSRGSGNANNKDLRTLQALDKFYPFKFRNGLSPEALKDIQVSLQEKWMALKGRSNLDCVRIYLICTRKWPYFGASLFQAKWKQGSAENVTSTVIWLVASEDCVSLLELGSMMAIASFTYSQVLTFGGCQEDFMLVISHQDGRRSQKLLFSLPKPKILDLTLIIADYMNALGQNGVYGSSGTQPDILKCTPDHQARSEVTNKYCANLDNNSISNDSI